MMDEYNSVALSVTATMYSTRMCKYVAVMCNKNDKIRGWDHKKECWYEKFT